MELVGRWRVKGVVVGEWGVNLDFPAPPLCLCTGGHSTLSFHQLMGEGLRRRLRSEKACLGLEDS